MARPPKPRSSPHGTQSWLAVVRAYNLCDAVMTARLATLGVRVAEHEVLANLASAPGITQQTLAARCFVAKSGVSMLLTQMESRGWVRREAHPDDRRARIVVATERAREAAPAAYAIAEALYDEALAGLADDERRVLHAALLKITENLQATEVAQQTTETTE